MLADVRRPLRALCACHLDLSRIRALALVSPASPALFVYSMIAIGIQRAFRSLTHHPTQASRPFGRWLRRIQSPRMGHSTGGYNPRRLELQSCRDNAMLEISMGRKYQNILQRVGNTPVVRINRLAPQGVNLFVKIEAFNPLGSVKDRLALGVIEAAEKSGELKPGQTVIEATSGNTGIGLAMVCAAKGYPLVVTMAAHVSVARRRLMRFLGAKVVLTPQALRGMGMVNKAVELAKTHGWFLTRQFENEANPDMHSRTTAQEILRDFAGAPLDYWVTGYGTQ